MSITYRLFIFLLTFYIGACGSTQWNMSASDDEDKDVGLGGTGLIANTGKGNGGGVGGTGVVGEITGFGSIFVNGIEIEYDNKTIFTIDGKPAAYQQLELGDMVEVLTTDANNHTDALLINKRHEVIGKVESADSRNKTFNVLGQTIIQAINKGGLPEVGNAVAVSGFRVDEKTILSTKVTPVDSMRTLLRAHTELPFKGQTTRWLVQAYTQNGKATFHLNGSEHVITVSGKEKGLVSDSSRLQILELKKSALGHIKVDQVVEPTDVPHGRPVPHHIPMPDGNMMQRSTPWPGPMNNRHNM